TASPIQMVREVSAVANGGKLLLPRLLHEVVDGKGQPLVTLDPKIVRQVKVDPQNLAIMRQGMRMVVTVGSGSLAAVPNVAVAGKTGTAEYFKLAGTREHLTHGWFLGFAPYEKP